MDLYQDYCYKAKDYEYLQEKVRSYEGDIFEAEIIIKKRKLELEALKPFLLQKHEEMLKAREEWDKQHGK